MERSYQLAGLALLVLLASPATASDVYRCETDGRTILQGTPCPDGSTITHIPGSPSPSRRSRAQAQYDPPPVLEPPENSAWRVRESASPIDDSRTVVMSVLAAQNVRDRYGREHRPSLTLRCSEGDTALFINFDGFHMSDYSSYGSVTLRVDGRSAFTVRMAESTDNLALGLWRGAPPIRTARRLLGGDTLTVRATPYSNSPITIAFPISGIAYELQPLRQACRW